MNNKMDVLGTIVECQKHCASVRITIGGTSKTGMVMKNCILVHNCPAVVLSKLVKEFDCISVTEEGVYIPCKE